MMMTGAAARGSLLSQSAIRAIRTYSSLYESRRVANRSGWNPPPSDDPDHFVLPDERLGNQMDVNWALTTLSIAPQKEAYHNLFSRGLQFLSSSPISPEKATVVTPNNDRLALFSNGSALAEYRSLLRQVRMHFSEADHVFLTDGALGSLPSVSVPTRFVSDDADTALFLHHLLPRVPATNPFHWTPSLNVFISSKVPAVSDRLGGSGPFAVVDEAGGNVIVNPGRSDFTQIQDLLASVFAKAVPSADLLRCDARLSGNALSFVFDGAGKGSAFGSAKGDLFGARHVVVSGSAVSRLWDGVTTSSSLFAPGRGDIVTKGTVTTPLVKRGNSAGLPSSMFLLSASASSPITRVTAAQFEGELAKGGFVLTEGAGFKSVLSAATDLFVVDGNASEAAVSRLLADPSSNDDQAKKSKAQKKSAK